MPELLDVLDEFGQPTGQTKTKQQILLDGDWRLVVHAWIVDDAGNLLVQQRAHGRSIFDGLWDVSVGGGVAAGELPQAAIVREVHEELGLVIPAAQFDYLGTWQIPPKKVSETKVMKDFSNTYLVRTDSIDLNSLTLQADEVADVALLPLNELLSTIINPESYQKWVPHGSAYYLEVIDAIATQGILSHHVARAEQ